MSIPKLFQLDTIVVNEKLQVLKWGNSYQLLDETGNEIGFVKENVPGWAKILRLFLNKSFLPFELQIQDENQNVMARIERGFTFWMSNVNVYDQNNKLIGNFKAKFKLFGSEFEILDENKVLVGKIKGDWKGWDFTITDNNGKQIGTVNKKWAGAMKELFTSADKYKVQIDPSVQEDENKILMVSVAITVDMIMKESK